MKNQAAKRRIVARSRMRSAPPAEVPVMSPDQPRTTRTQAPPSASDQPVEKTDMTEAEIRRMLEAAYT